jgi:hypothetical protein
MGTRENAKKEKTQRRMDGWSKMELEKSWTDRRCYQRQRHIEKLSFGLRKTTAE